MPGSDDDTTHVYTDGACSGNPGPGGWAWAVPGGPSASGGAETTTNQRMELQAVLEALRALPAPVTVHSDSTYVVNCFNDRWYEGWLKRDWKNSQRKPVANRDLWEPLVEMFVDRRSELNFVWVKGHSGDEMNELVDAMAVAEVAKLKDEVKPKDPDGGEPAPAGPSPPWPVDRAVAVTGLRDLDEDRLEAIEDTVAGLDPAQDILVSGLRRGAELETAERAVARGIPLAVVLPYADPAVGWPRPVRERFDHCLDKADWTVTLGGDSSSPSKAVAARNAWTWRSVVGVVVVGDPQLTVTLEDDGLGVIEIP